MSSNRQNDGFEQLIRAFLHYDELWKFQVGAPNASSLEEFFASSDQRMSEIRQLIASGKNDVAFQTIGICGQVLNTDKQISDRKHRRYQLMLSKGISKGGLGSLTCAGVYGSAGFFLYQRWGIAKVISWNDFENWKLGNSISRHLEKNWNFGHFYELGVVFFKISK